MQPGTLSQHLGVSHVRPAPSAQPVYPAAGCTHPLPLSAVQPCSGISGPPQLQQRCSHCLPPTRLPAFFRAGSGSMAASQVC